MNERAKWLSDFYAEVAEGKEMETKATGTFGWGPGDVGPNMIAKPENWRIKPELWEGWVLVNKANGEGFDVLNTLPTQENLSKYRWAKVREVAE